MRGRDFGRIWRALGRSGCADILVPAGIFAAAAVILIASISNAGGASSAEEKRIAERAVRRAAVSCYAAEGAYPESYEYLRDNYGVRVNEDKYAVYYEVFASNIMPEITVVSRDGGR